MQPKDKLDKMTKIQDFLQEQAVAQDQKSLWFEMKGIRVYTRAGPMVSYTPGFSVIKAMCVSNVTVTGALRTGIFSKFAEEAIAFCKPLGFVEFQIENVISFEMLGYCEKHKMLMKRAEYGSYGNSYWLSI